jgi:tRNA modification GTPase
MQPYQQSDTIVAIATAPGMGAIAVLRLSGPEAISIADSVFKPKGNKRLADAAGNSLLFGEIKDGDELVDEVVVSLFRGPKSYTGEDIVEISCHGSQWIQRKLLHLLLNRGARLAEPGEFTLRAWFNGKMDLSQAEAVADLIHSENEASVRVALRQMRGGISRELAALREELIRFAGLIELELDFTEEDVEFANRAELHELLSAIDGVLRKLSESFALGNAIKNGIPVAIVGAPNAGKSTLLNALLNEERAIVSDIAGTTRDTIEDEIHIRGLTFRFIDTAGLRDTADTIEQIGIRKAMEKLREASVVIFIYDASESAELTAALFAEVKKESVGKKIITIANKSDRTEATRPDWAGEDFCKISALKGEGIEELKNDLADSVETSALDNNQVIITNARHYESLQCALESTARIRTGLSSGLSGELVALDVREALRHIGNITGVIEHDRDVLGAIFTKFCIGK